MKVLITGGAGYIGTELAAILNENPSISEIVIYDNLMRGNYNLFIGQTKQKDPQYRWNDHIRTMKYELNFTDLLIY